MKKTLIVSIIIFTFSISKAVYLTTNDEKKFQYTNEEDIAALRYSQTINNLLNDFDEHQDLVIPLSEINSSDWQHIQQCLKLSYKTQQATNKEKAGEELNTFLATLERDSLFSFINGVNFLSIPELLEISLNTWLSNHALDVFEAYNSAYTFNNYIKKLLKKNLVILLTKLLQADPSKPTGCKKILPSCHSINAISYSPCGNFIASSCYDGYVHIWNVQKKEIIHSFSANSPILSICFSPDGEHIAAGCASRSLIIWDIKTLKLLHAFNDHNGPIYSICYSPDGKLLASRSGDGIIKIRNLQTKKHICTLVSPAETMDVVPHRLHRFRSSIESRFDNQPMQVCFSQDGKFIASGSNYGTLHIWNVESGNLIHIFANGISNYLLCFNPTNNFITAVSDKIQTWNTNTGELVQTMEEDSDNDNSICSMLYSPDGNFIIAGLSNGFIQIWDTSTGKLVNTMKAHLNTIISLCFSPESNFLATSSERTIRIWDYMKSIKRLIKNSSTDQCLLLALASVKKRQNQKLILDRPHLRGLFDAYDDKTQKFIKKILNVTSIATT